MKNTTTTEYIRDMATSLRLQVNLLADRLDNIATGVTAPLPAEDEIMGDYEILIDIRDHLIQSIEAIDGWFGKRR